MSKWMSRPSGFTFAMAGLLAIAALVPASAHGACCRVIKVDAEVATVDLRVCEPDAAGHCGTLLFAGPLALGASAEVCVAGDLLVYEEWDLAQAAFGPPTSAVCQDGGDVEL